MYSEYFRL